MNVTSQTPRTPLTARARPAYHSAMLERDDLRNDEHVRDVERVLAEIEAAWEKADETADALDRDGASASLVGALRDTTAALAAERSRFDSIAGHAATTQPELDQRQQQLAV